jgi:SAM-dependent methyltransferase
LDAGCGSQRYRSYCSHLIYKAQDFGKYKTDNKKMLGQEGMGGKYGYEYGELDYVGDIWSIQEQDEKFDVILCAEVLEHIPFPNETIREFSRLLKRNGRLILTAPSNCLRHMDPYFFYTGFSDRWYEKFLEENGFSVKKIEPIGDYYSWMSVEVMRTAVTHSLFSKILLAPAFLYYFFKKKSPQSIDTLCMGYHIVAIKI